ncbi:hypothetical protein B0J11DRAFT_68808 [Dendryphion nanum]|uniref:Uncharacterized protein n=1 Tax=Dendryphion nanum TaxID=256645 RepID=A0A9P9IGF2_9PLEO|nr:hypothetical protein B0J11DRAFT_68808 [Dendryphion nanum]
MAQTPGRPVSPLEEATQPPLPRLDRRPVSPLDRTSQPLLSGQDGSPNFDLPIPMAPQDPSMSISPTAAPQNNSPNHPTFTPHRSVIGKKDWAPFTLRWYLLLIPIVVSFSLGIATALLTWYSQKNFGLGKDDGSSGMLFGWRFTPTLIAVLYTQTVVILFEDIKRTEPFARLARPPTGGATAAGTLLYSPQAWWNILIDATVRRKKIGKTTWSLLCVTVVYIMALLAISPLSSAFLTSEEISVPRTVPFNRLVPRANAQLPLNSTRETYLRTTSSLMQNISTSTWSSDTSLTLPFWPLMEDSQFGPTLASNYSSWSADTTVMRSGLTCQNMSVTTDMANNVFWSGYDIPNRNLRNGTTSMLSFNMRSDNGCQYNLTMHPTVDIAYWGSITWTNASTFPQPVGVGMAFWNTSPNPRQVGPVYILSNTTSTNPYSRLITSKECDNMELIIVNTPWTKRVSDFDPTRNDPVFPNTTYEKSPDFRIRAVLCEPQYTMTRKSFSASTGPDSKLSDPPGILLDLQSIPNSLFNRTAFGSLMFHSRWKEFFAGRSKDPLTLASEFERRFNTPWLHGPGAILGALSDFDIETMIEDSQLADKIARIKGRYFAEVLRDAMVTPSTMSNEEIQGIVSTMAERVIVITEVGIALSVLFLVSFFLLVLILWSSRSSQRPLNLASDPASTVGMSILLDPRQARSSTLRSMHKASKSDLYTVLKRENYSTFGSVLRSETSRGPVPTNTKPRAKRDWKPAFIHLRALIALGLFLLLVLVAVLVLNAFSAEDRLSQLAFIYEADVSRLGLSFKTFAPISIAPAFISVIIGLWWDQLDMSFRILQPYISMSRSPTPINSGAGLTYRSKTWIGAAIKAARHQHWVLFSITLGSTLCQVLTVSMSALFESKADNLLHTTTLARTWELRQIPHLIPTTIDTKLYARGDFDSYALDEIFKIPSNNYLYSATVQLTLNRSRLPWSNEEWSFIPVDLRTIEDNEVGVDKPATNVSLSTSAIRARLECQRTIGIGNISNWIIPFNGSRRMTSALKNGTFKGGFLLNSTWIHDGRKTFLDPYTQVGTISCCSNGTIDKPQQASFGYWTTTNRTDSHWPPHFVTKWIRGDTVSFVDDYKDTWFYYTKMPTLQAAECVPVIETAEASVNIDKRSGMVYSYKILNKVVSAEAAWMEDFTAHDPGDGTNLGNYTGAVNVTASYGTLFIDSILQAVVRPFSSFLEGLDTFTVREPERGLNMDIMTYSMSTIAGSDMDALSNYTTLVNAANRTFQTYFQHFVHNKLSLSDDGWTTYQRIDERLPNDLSQPITTNGTRIPQRTFPNLSTSPEVVATVSNRTQLLHMNAVATYISVAILIWLIGTSLVVAVLQRRYTRYMIRNVESIADILVLIAGSENFLRLVQERGVSLKRDRNIMTRLGWFKGRDGEVRWGVEVVGGPDPVEWVSKPTDPTMQEKIGLVRRTTQGLFKVVERVGTGKPNQSASPLLSGAINRS